ncbi:GNAT family N-acetyltransferase [Streptomyces sp. NPDC020480]|uniref:GNAT family N-acetyltransferase n=1 Tax=Streptomyces sp. NPDC020480 TaxID=3365076 RepID=UPI00379050B2
MKRETRFQPSPETVTATTATAPVPAGPAAPPGGVTIRPVEDVAGIAAVADFFADVWRTPRTNPPYPAELLSSLCHAGGEVLGAYDGPHLIGATAAVFSPPATGAVYSLVAAARHSDRGVGFALKQAQRSWALRHGARAMVWTFDPLVGRNARFNLVKLGAVGVEYLIDFYGPMRDGLNDGDESDRLTARWDLLDGGAHGTGGRDGEATASRQAAPVTRLAPDGGPLAVRDGDRIWCRVPADVVALRATDATAALRWRHAVREVFTEAFAEGFMATAMTRDGWYLLTPEATA